MHKTPKLGLRSACGAALVALGAASGCSSAEPAPPATTIGGDDGGVPDATAAVSFEVQPLGCDGGGMQSVAAVAGSKIAFASLAPTAKSNPCTTMNGVSEVQLWDVCYAASDGKGGYAGTVVTSQPYLAPTGVGLALDAAGEATLAFTGGGPAKLRCGASELFFAKTAGGAFGAPTSIASGSQSAGVVPEQETQCAAQNVCNSGDATGYWPSIAFGPAGQPAVVFRDLHFGFATDDFASSDVEYAPGPGFSKLTIDVARGGGTYLRLAFTPAGKAAVAHYNADGTPAVWVNVETGSGWHSKKVADGKIGEQIGFSVSDEGLFALAYYDEGTSRLRYTESLDGATWSAPSNVDLDGSTGFYPSLAFDAAGDPAIAYYRCNAKGPSEPNCNAAEDGLYLARRKNGKWRVELVRAERGLFEGLYPALAFVSGKAKVAYQARSFDPASQKNTITWMVAEEQ
jgi:hypothetical protein